MNDRVHVKIPRKAAPGEIIQVRTKLNHPMESGWRKLHDGERVPKNLINRFVCEFDGTEVFRAEMDAGTAGNPYLSFFVRVDGSGVFRLLWSGEQGEQYQREVPIEVT